MVELVEHLQSMEDRPLCFPLHMLHHQVWSVTMSICAQWMDGGYIDGCMDVYIQIDGFIDGWIDGWMNRLIHRQIGSQIDNHHNHHNHHHHHHHHHPHLSLSLPMCLSLQCCILWYAVWVLHRPLRVLRTAYIRTQHHPHGMYGQTSSLSMSTTST